MDEDLWLLLPHLGPGGAQKVALLVAAYFMGKGWKVRLVTVLPGPGLAHTIPDGLLITDLGPAVDRLWKRDHWNRSWIARGRRFLAPKRRLHRLAARVLLGPLCPVFESVVSRKADWRSRLLRWCVAGIDGPPSWQLSALFEREKPKRVVSFLSRTNIRSCSALWMQNCHLVISERNDINRQHLPFPWSRFRRLLYRRADVLTANTTGVMASMAPQFDKRKLALLPNPLPMPEISEAVGSAKERRGFVTVARLVPQKGIDVLIQALALTSGIAKSWDLTLVGDGPERECLKSLAEQSGLTERIHFTGFQSNPQTFLRRAAVFVLPSRFEGMPNALMEAMASGLAVVVTDSSPGPLEVVDQGVTGLVVPSEDPVALKNALENLVANPELRHQLGSAAREKLRQMDWPVVGPIWESLLGGPQV